MEFECAERKVTTRFSIGCAIVVFQFKRTFDVMSENDSSDYFSSMSAVEIVCKRIICVVEMR